MTNKKIVKKANVWVVSPASGEGKDIARHLNGSKEIKCAYSSRIKYEKWTAEESFVILLDADSIDSPGSLFNDASKVPLKNPAVLFNVDPQLSLEREFLHKGYKGIFFKNSSLNLIEKGMKKIFEGNLWFSRQVLQEFVLEGLQINIDDNAKLAPPLTKGEEEILDILTPREEEILLLVASGAKNKDIAENLCLSPHTIRGHISSIFSKIGVENRLQAMLWGTKYLESMKKRLSTII